MPTTDRVLPPDHRERERALDPAASFIVQAPAGSGKTTLLGMWREAQAEVTPVAWLTLENEDNDPVVLWAHALEALRQACPDLSETLSPKSLFEGIADLMLPQLVNELSERYDLPGTYASICFVILVSVMFFIGTERIERWLRPGT